MDIHLKKNVLFGAYVFFNILLTILLLDFENGYLIGSFFLLGGHARDVVNVFYQLFNVKQILRSLPDIPDEEINTICCLVPVYNEDPVLLKKNLDGLTTQKLSTNTTVLIVLLFDGLGEHNTELFESIDNVIDFNCGGQEQAERWYQNWKSKEDTRLAYRVGRYNDTTVILSHKENNSGKKDSLIIGERFITDIRDIMSLGVHEINFIYHTDGDTVSDENCLNEILKSLVDDKNLDGVSGLLRTYTKDNASCTERAFVTTQDFQYLFSLIVRRMTESLLNTTTCLPGCSNMIRISQRTDVAIEKYGNLPANESSLLQTVTRMQGTDRRYTTLLLKQGSNLQMNWRAFVHTEPPLDASSFINQRRRWSSNSFFNSIVLLYSSNIPLYIRASTIIDIGRVFSTLFRFISYFCFWIYMGKFSTMNIVFVSLFLVLPYLYAFAWIFYIIPEWKGMIVGFFLNKIFMPFLSVIAVSKMYFTSTNFAWGRTDDRVQSSPPEPNSSARNTRKDRSLEDCQCTGFYRENPKPNHVSQ